MSYSYLIVVHFFFVISICNLFTTVSSSVILNNLSEQTFGNNSHTNGVYTPLNESLIESGFKEDGWFIVDKMISSKSGYRGYYGENMNITSYIGKPKKIYYVEGSGWDMGYLHGVLTVRNGDAKAMCDTYIHHIIINMLNEQWE